MLFFTPVQPPFQPVTLSLYSELDFLDSVARQAASDYAVAHARVEAIQRRRSHGLHRQQQVACGDWHRSTSVPAWSSEYTSRRSPMHPFEELLHSAVSEQERRRSIVARQREAQRMHAAAEAEAHREAERHRAFVALQRVAEAHQEAERLARAQRAQAQLEAQREVLFALLGLRSTVEPNHPTPARPSTTHIRQNGPSLARTPITQPVVSGDPVDRKGKGKAVDVPVAQSLATSQKVDTSTTKLPTFKDELEARIRDETDPDIQESLLILYSDLFDISKPQDQQPVAGPSVPRKERTQIVQEPIPATSEPPIPTPSQPLAAAVPDTAAPSQHSESGTALHRTPVLPPAVAAKLLKFYHARRARRLSLTEIKEIEDALRQLEGTFEFPDQLDFVHPITESESESEAPSDEPGPLAYSPNNSPLHAYEHALNALLARLDSVESNGDLEVRGRRKEVVKEVERALETMERRIEASRERERERSRERTKRASDVPIGAEELSRGALSAEVAVAESSSVDAAASEVPVAEFSSAEAAIGSSDGDALKAEATLTSPHALVLEPASVADELHYTAVTHEEPSAFQEYGHSPDDRSSETNLFSSATDDSSDPVNSSPSEMIVELPSPNQETDTTTPFMLPEEPAAVPSERIDTPLPIDTALAPWSRLGVLAQAPEAISRELSTATDVTDATFVTANTALPSPTATAVDELRVAPAEVEVPVLTSTLPAARPSITTPTMSLAPSSTEGPVDTFLLASTPLAEDESERKRRASNGSSGEDELEIISREELEAAQKDSDWSDVESDAA